MVLTFIVRDHVIEILNRVGFYFKKLHLFHTEINAQFQGYKCYLVFVYNCCSENILVERSSYKQILSNVCQYEIFT